MSEIKGILEQAIALEERGLYAQAEPLYVKALQLKEDALGANHPDLGVDYFNLGLLFYAQDKLEQAASCLEISLKLETLKSQGNSPDLLPNLEFLGEVYFELGWSDKAEVIYRRFLELQKQFLPERGAELIRTMRTLADICETVGKLSDANELRVLSHQVLRDEMLSGKGRKAS